MDDKPENAFQGHSDMTYDLFKKKCLKVSVTDALDGSYQVSLYQQIRFYNKVFGNKHCR